MPIFCIGDIHGKFDILAERIRELPRNSHVLCVGDIGVGFADSAEPSCLYKVNGIASQRDIYLWMIRGNHDNPYLFRSLKDSWNNELSNIKLMADVDSLELDGNHVIFVGGAISVDRSHEGRIEGQSWWEDEPVHESCPSRVYHIVEEFGPADILITHAGPITTLPVIDAYEPNIYHYSQTDPTLLEDVNAERTLLSDCVQFSRATTVVYGHYHVPLEYTNSGVNYRCVAELELWEFKNLKTSHLPQAIISEEEKAKVETVPITLKAPLNPLPSVHTAKVAAATTEDAATEDLISKTEELRKTAAVQVRAPIKPHLPTIEAYKEQEEAKEKELQLNTNSPSTKSLAQEQNEVLKALEERASKVSPQLPSIEPQLPSINAFSQQNTEREVTPALPSIDSFNQQLEEVTKENSHKPKLPPL